MQKAWDAPSQSALCPSVSTILPRIPKESQHSASLGTCGLGMNFLARPALALGETESDMVGSRGVMIPALDPAPESDLWFSRIPIAILDPGLPRAGSTLDMDPLLDLDPVSI